MPSKNCFLFFQNCYSSGWRIAKTTFFQPSTFEGDRIEFGIVRTSALIGEPLFLLKTVRKRSSIMVDFVGRRLSASSCSWSCEESPRLRYGLSV